MESSISRASWCAVALGAILAVPLAGCGKPSHVLKGTFETGDVIRDEVHVAMASGRIVVAAQGNTAEGKASMAIHSVTEIHILTVDDNNQPTKFKVSCLVDQFAGRFEMPGEQPSESNEPGILQGESIVFELFGGEWKKKLFGKEPTSEQAKEINERANPLDEDVVPPGHVTVGESWTLSGLALRKIVGAGLHNLSGSMSSQFENIVEHDGEQCAKISSEGTVTGTMLGPESQEMTGSMSLQVATFRSLKSFCDQSTGKGLMKVEGDFVSAGTSIRLSINGPITFVQKQTKL